MKDIEGPGSLEESQRTWHGPERSSFQPVSLCLCAGSGGVVPDRFSFLIDEPKGNVFAIIHVSSIQQLLTECSVCQLLF